MLTSWYGEYAAIAGWLTETAPAARASLTGTTACVDEIFRIDAHRLALLVERRAAAPMTADDVMGRKVLKRVLDRVAAARGGELLTRWPAGVRWFADLLGNPDLRQVGGTGPQASWALAELGAPSVLALADRSVEQLSVLDPRICVCVAGDLRPVSAITPRGKPAKLAHVVLEFTGGTQAGRLVVPRSTRLILRFSDERIERDEQYAMLTPKLAADVGAGLVSGLNGLSPDDRAGDRSWLAELAAAWSRGGLTVIHHELAEFPTIPKLRAALEMRMATSIGLSLSELFMLAGRKSDPRLLARQAAEQAGAQRVIVHADEWSLAVHRDDPGHQRRVLLTGSALASARARKGRATRRLVPPPEATYTDDLPAVGSVGDGWHATSVAAPYLRRPAATIGLGDTFVAGVLLAESLA